MCSSLPAPRSGASTDLDDLAVLLAEQFSVSLSRARAMVRDCRPGLDGVPSGALPELLYRLACQRLRAQRATVQVEGDRLLRQSEA